MKLKARSRRNIHGFPVVFGPVLDGQVIHLEATLNDFFIGNRSLEETAAILLGRYLDDTQLCVCDQKIADSLMVVKEEEYDVAN